VRFFVYSRAEQFNKRLHTGVDIFFSTEEKLLTAMLPQIDPQTPPMGWTMWIEVFLKSLPV
jgi:hypothetical protein